MIKVNDVKKRKEIMKWIESKAKKEEKKQQRKEIERVR